MKWRLVACFPRVRFVKRLPTRSISAQRYTAIPLYRYTEAGYLSFENNAVERLVKNPAIGRKKNLFVGCERGGHDAAVFYSLVSSAKMNAVEPFAWLSDVFTKLPNHRDGEAFEQAAAGQPVTSTELDELLPDRWLESHPQHAWTIDTIRRKEREAKEKSRRQNRRRSHLQFTVRSPEFY